MKNLKNTLALAILTFLSINVSAIEYGAYTCTTELTNPDPDSFPLGVYANYIHRPAFDSYPDSKLMFSQSLDEYTDLTLSPEDIANGIVSSKYILFRDTQGNISAEFIYNYDTEMMKTMYFMDKQSDVEFILNIIHIYDGNEDQNRYNCVKHEAHVS